jgi:hypothetical protein
MPDNWTYVAAAYVLAAAVFGAYWLRLGRRERELAALAAPRPGDSHRPPAVLNDPGAVRIDAGEVRTDRTSRSQAPSKTGHPRPEPASRPPLQP